jgi:hypothetical protein
VAKENFLRDRRAVSVGLLVCALYGGIYSGLRFSGAIAVLPAPPAASAERAPAPPAAKNFSRRHVQQLTLGKIIFTTAYPPLLFAFYPALLAESLLLSPRRTES